MKLFKSSRKMYICLILVLILGIVSCLFLIRPDNTNEFNELVSIAEVDFKDCQYDDCIKAIDSALLLEKNLIKAARILGLQEKAKIQIEIQKYIVEAEKYLDSGAYEQSLNIINNAYQLARSDEMVRTLKTKVENLMVIEKKSAYSKGVKEWLDLAYKTQDPDEQAAYLKKVLEREPNNFKASYTMGYYFYNKENYQEALNYFNNLPANSPYSHITKMDIYLAQGKNRNAQIEAQGLLGKINTYKKSFQSTIRLYVGNIYQNQKFYDSARKEYLKAIELDPENVRAYVSLGTLYSEKKDYISAMTEYQKALQLPEQDNNAALHLSLARLYSMMGEMESHKALREYKRALELDPDNDTILNSYAYVLCQYDEDLDEALRLMRKAIRIRQYDKKSLFHYLDSIGWIYFKRGKNNLALRRIKKGIALIDFNDHTMFYPLAEGYYHLGEVFYKEKEIQLALECCAMAKELDTHIRDIAGRAKNLQERIKTAI